jgi:hypothetical protein
LIEERFPDFMYGFADLNSGSRRGFNAENTVLSHLTSIPVKSLIKMSHKQRGKHISKGQLASEKFKSFASKHAASLVSSLRVSKPQRILFEMFKSVDPHTKMEFGIATTRGYKSFDFMVPSLNAVIEMHGRVFHDINKSPNGLKTLCKGNVQNDEFKKDVAIASGYNYFVFWDDETHTWFNTIRTITSEEPISYADAKDKVNEEDRRNASNGHDHTQKP